jgi:hypothetical protein
LDMILWWKPGTVLRHSLHNRDDAFYGAVPSHDGNGSPAALAFCNAGAARLAKTIAGSDLRCRSRCSNGFVISRDGLR